MSKRNWESLLGDLVEGNAIIDSDIAGIKWAAEHIAELEDQITLSRGHAIALMELAENRDDAPYELIYKAHQAAATIRAVLQKGERR